MYLLKKLLNHFEREIQLNKKYYAEINKAERDESSEESKSIDIKLDREYPSKDSTMELNKLLQIKDQSFPYSMDDMMDLDIDILLKQPTMLILSWGIDECEKVISRILNHCLCDFEETPLCLLINSVTDVFVMYRNHPCTTHSAYGLDKAKLMIDWVYSETNKRIKFASTIKKKAYAGTPIYLLLDNFSIIRRKPQDPIAAKLAHIMLCARQANVHTIVFDRPDSFQLSEFDWFSSIAILNNCYRDKYRKIIAPEYRNVEPGTFFFSPNCGEPGIYEI